MNITLELTHDDIVRAVGEFAIGNCEAITRDIAKMSIHVERYTDGTLTASVSGPIATKPSGPLDR